MGLPYVSNGNYLYNAHGIQKMLGSAPGLQWLIDAMVGAMVGAIVDEMVDAMSRQ